MLQCAVLCGLSSIRQSSCERFPVLWPYGRRPLQGLARGLSEGGGEVVRSAEKKSRRLDRTEASLTGLLEAAFGRREARRWACPAAASPVYGGVCWCWFCGMSFDRELDTFLRGRMNALFRKAGILGGMVSLVFTFGFKSCFLDGRTAHSVVFPLPFSISWAYYSTWKQQINTTVRILLFCCFIYYWAAIFITEMNNATEIVLKIISLLMKFQIVTYLNVLPHKLGSQNHRNPSMTTQH